MLKTCKITLGEQSFDIGLLPIGALREIDADFTETVDAKLTPKDREKFFFDQAIRILKEALSFGEKKWTEDDVKALPASSVKEIFEARNVILIHAGLMSMKTEPKPGEGNAEV